MTCRLTMIAVSCVLLGAGSGCDTIQPTRALPQDTLPETAAPSAEAAAAETAEPPAPDDNGVTPQPRTPVEVLGAGVSTPSTARRAPAVRSDPNGVSLNFVNAPVGDVAKAILGDMLGQTYAVDPRVQGTMTLRTRQPIARADVLSLFENTLKASGAALVRGGDGYRIVPTAEAQRSATPVASAPGAARSPGYGVEVLRLNYVSAAALQRMMEPLIPKDSSVQFDTDRNTLTVSGSASDRANIIDLARTFDVDRMRGMSFALHTLQFGQAGAVADELGQVFGADKATAGGVRFVPIERLNAVLAISSQPRYLDQVSAWISRLDQVAEGSGRRVYVYKVQNGRAIDLADTLNRIFMPYSPFAPQQDTRMGSRLAPGRQPAGLSTVDPMVSSPFSSSSQGGGYRGLQGSQGSQNWMGGLSPIAQSPLGALSGSSSYLTTPVTPIGVAESPDGIRVIADEGNNALVIYATPQGYKQIQEALRQLDLAPVQIMIEATVAEVTLNDTLRYGLQWFFRQGNSAFTFSRAADGAVNAAFPGFSYVLSAGDARVVLDALDSITQLKVLSAPQVMVINNQIATLQVGDQVPITTRSAVSVTDPAAPIVNTVEFRDTGVILQVIPRVNTSGLVSMDIAQEVSDVTATTTSNIDSPTIQQRRVQSSVAIHDNETIALGGLIRNRQENGNSGVPLLKNIPVVGNLFSDKSYATDRTELLILITPRVIRDTNAARAATQELRSKLRSMDAFAPPRAPAPDTTPPPQP